MFILTVMLVNGIQTPSEEQPEPICLKKRGLLTSVEDVKVAPSDPRFCPPPPSSSSEATFGENGCTRSRRAMQTLTDTSGRPNRSCLASSRGKLWSDSRENVSNAHFPTHVASLPRAPSRAPWNDGLKKLSHSDTKCLSLP